MRKARTVIAALVAAFLVAACGPADLDPAGNGARSKTNSDAVSPARAMGALIDGILVAAGNLDVLSEMRGELDETVTYNPAARDALDAARAKIAAVTACVDPAATVAPVTLDYDEPFVALADDEVEEALSLPAPFADPAMLRWNLSNSCGQVMLIVSSVGYRLYYRDLADKDRWTVELQSRWVGNPGRDPKARINEALAGVYPWPTGYDRDRPTGVALADFVDDLRVTSGAEVQAYLDQRDGDLLQTLNLVARSLLNADVDGLTYTLEQQVDVPITFATATDPAESLTPSALVVNHTDSSNLGSGGALVHEVYEEHWTVPGLGMPTRLGRLQLCGQPAWDTITDGAGNATSIGHYSRSRIDDATPLASYYYMVDGASLQIIPTPIDCGE